MITRRKIAGLAWRGGVCLLLLVWIFQAIFYNEGRIAWNHSDAEWQALSRWERLQIAWQYGPPELWKTLASMDSWWLFMSLALMGLTIFIGVLRWQIVLRVHGLQLPLARTTQISFVAHFFNSFLLGSIGGDVLKAYYVARETHHKKTEAVVTVVVDRLIGLFSMLVFGCLMIIPNYDLLFSNHRLRGIILTVLVMTAVCGGFLIVGFWGGVSKRLPRARQWLRRLPRGEALERSLEAFRHFGRDKTFFWRIIPITMLQNVVLVAHFYVLTLGFHQQVPVLALAAIVPVVTSISALPITPSGLGVRENLYVWMLAVPSLGVPAAQALLLSLVGYAGSLVWSLVGGVIYLTLKQKQHLTEITQE